MSTYRETLEALRAALDDQKGPLDARRAEALNLVTDALVSTLEQLASEETYEAPAPTVPSSALGTGAPDIVYHMHHTCGGISKCLDRVVDGLASARLQYEQASDIAAEMRAARKMLAEVMQQLVDLSNSIQFKLAMKAGREATK